MKREKKYQENLKSVSKIEGVGGGQYTRNQENMERNLLKILRGKLTI